MHPTVKLVLKLVSLLGGACVIAFSFLSPESIRLPFSPLTGFIEAYNTAEAKALALIPDEIEDFVSKLYEALC